MFNYEEGTRGHYQNDAVARDYHAEFTQLKGLNGARFRFIAARERRAVRTLLSQIPAKRVVDVPAGTGKMASVFREFGCDVMACDVSENMLAIARETYQAEGPDNVTFQVVDLESATQTLEGPFDAVVCVRLMHRVPDDVKDRMLAQIAALAPYAVVSFGVDSAYQRLRQSLRASAFRSRDAGAETRPTSQGIRQIIEPHFENIRDIPVAAGISAERMYLLNFRQISGS
jgi:SAM-dependent methyltransferase